MRYLFTLLFLGLGLMSFAQHDKMCECDEFKLDMFGKLEKMKTPAEMEKAVEIHKVKIEDCQKIFKEYRAKLSTLSAKKKKKEEKKYLKYCKASRELQKLEEKEGK